MRRPLIAAAIVLALVSGAMIVAALAYLRGQAVTSGEQLTAAFAQVIEEQTSRTIQTIDQQLQLSASRLQQLEASGGLNEASARALLREQLKGLPFLRAIWVLDAQGRIAYDSDTGNIGVDLSDRAYVRHYREQPQAEFQLAAPVKSVNTGGWFLPAVRPLRRSGGVGGISGLIVAAVEPSYFDTLWQGLDAGADGSVALARVDGTLMMRSPFVDAKMGQAFPDEPVFRLWRQGGRIGTVQQVSAVDGQSRIFAYRVLSQQPELSVIAGQSLDHVLAPWYRLRAVALAAWLLTGAAFVVLGLFLDRAWRAVTRAEQRASETAQRLSMATDAATIGIWDWDSRNALQWYATPTYFTMLGETPTDDIARRNDWVDRLHTQDREAVLQRIAAVLEGQDLPYYYEARLRHADGSYRWVSVSGHVLARDAQGRPTRMMGVRVDITARKQVEEALRASEARYRELFYGNPQPMWVFDTETLAFLAVNAAAIAHYGYSEAEFLGMTILDIRPPEDHDYLLKQATRPEPGLRIAGTRTHLRRDGSRILVSISTHSMIYDGRPARLVLSTDITELRRSQQELEGLNQQLEARVEARGRELQQAMAQLLQAEKLAALGSLVSGVAHELNTPVGNVLMVASTLREGLEAFGQRLLAGRAKRSEVAEWTTRIGEASLLIERDAARAAKLVADFKQLSLEQDGTGQRSDFFLLRDVVDLALELQGLSPTDAHGPLRVEVDVSPAIRMHSHAEPLAQILTQLLRNTVLHAFESGAAGRIRIAARQLDGQVELHYEDDGRGIAEDALRRLFDPFYTTRLGQGGSGLGLYIVYKLITGTLGGTITAHSASGQGTRFVLRLPLQAPAGAD